ncbi:hypothetical protein [Mycolicibacterium chlorophenolicum]|uniref:Uncharacterized protein n=1 Tax=Mycolicibacterium chlorophenolicum TaxID=37916 RepID=A0A0J6VHS6_9MYCO|nr:hypothetical protein [Mycolicibacterium chlorophenolicum]KMO69834.1 hypothetical protein MCHLDSM_05946 [Mycolicibacterium chlorophenolicum]
MKTLTVRAISGAVIAEYPDFEANTPLRVLPAIVSNQAPTEGRIVDETWSFAGPTRHPEYALIRHDTEHVTISIERRRLQTRPTTHRHAFR